MVPSTFSQDELALLTPDQTGTSNKPSCTFCEIKIPKHTEFYRWVFLGGSKAVCRSCKQVANVDQGWQLMWTLTLRWTIRVKVVFDNGTGNRTSIYLSIH